MSNPEKSPFSDLGEAIDESLRQTYEKRGGTTMDAAERAKKIERREEIRRQLAELKAEKARRATAAGTTTAGTTTEAPKTEAPKTEPEPKTEPGPKPNETEKQEEKTPTVAETTKKAKKNSALKTVLVSATAIALAGVLGFGLAGGFKKDAPAPEQPTAIVQQVEATEAAEEHESIADLATYRGHFANEEGTGYNTEKHGDVNFGEELISGASEDEMKDELTDRMIQTGQLAATYYYMQEKTTDPSFGVDGAKFDNPDDLTEAMEDDAELHQKVYDYIKTIIGHGELSEDTVTGRFHNFYMESKFETGDVDTSNIEVVGCETTEDGTKVYKLEVTWSDKEGEHTDTYTFKERCGGQPLDEVDFTTTVRQIPDPGTGSEGTGSEGTGEEGTGSEGEGTGQEGTGEEGTGSESEGTGSEDTGSEGTGTENEGTGTENEGTGTENEGTGTENEGTGTENEGTGTETVITPKSEENLERIDDQIEEDIETDVHTGDIIITPTEDVTKVEPITEKPSEDDYQGAEPVIVKNDVAEDAEPIQGGEDQGGAPTQISPENDYSQDRGGANEVKTTENQETGAGQGAGAQGAGQAADQGEEAPANPVVADHEAQAAADAGEIPIEEAPGVDDIGSQELDDILAGLGIN